MLRRPNWARVPDFFHFGSVYGPETLFEGIREVPPGHMLIVSRQQVEIRKYWDLPRGPDLPGDEREHKAHVKELLRKAVRRHLMSDVPLGVFLSGGIDSSLIVALMSEMVNEPLKTFSIGFREEGYNEFSYSRQIASQFRTDHVELELDAERFFDALPELVWHHDEPVSLPASIPLFFLSKETVGRAKVILTGEGADELFLGYAHYDVMRRQANIADTFRFLCPPSARQTVVHLAQTLLGRDRPLLARLLLDRAGQATSFIEWIPREVADELCRGGHRDLQTADGHPDPVEEIFRDAPASRDFLSDVTYVDFKAFLITLLMKQDKMSMAASIETRVPFLDHELVEYCYLLPTRHKLANGIAKRILKQIAADYFSPDFIHRKKQGFPVPVIPWLLRDSTRSRFEEVLLDPRTVSRGIFDQEVVKRYLRRFKDSKEWERRAAAYFIWSLVNFELWMRVCIEGPTFQVSDVTSREASASSWGGRP
jgi:asparagine synthase (glutamine-hydrolysing)